MKLKKAFIILLLISVLPIALFSNDSKTQKIVIDPPDHYDRDMDIEVWTDQSTYYVGDDIQIGFRTNQDAYVYIFNTDTRGETRQIFPNYYDRNNRVKANRTYHLPDYNYSLRISGPSGREYLTAIAVRKKYSSLSGYLSFSSADPFPKRALSPKSLNGKLKIDIQKAEKSIRIEAGGKTQGIVVESGRGYSRYYDEDTTSFKVKDNRRRGRGKIRLKSVPSNSSVYVDGDYKGKTPIKIENLSYGNHFIEVTKRGYRTYTREVYVYSSDTMNITAYLRYSGHDYYYDDDFMDDDDDDYRHRYPYRDDRRDRDDSGNIINPYRDRKKYVEKKSNILE